MWLWEENLWKRLLFSGSSRTPGPYSILLFFRLGFLLFSQRQYQFDKVHQKYVQSTGAYMHNDQSTAHSTLLHP